MTLDELYIWMREHGAIAARVDADGGISLTLGEQPPVPIDPNGPWATYLREKAAARKSYARPEDDPELYGEREIPKELAE